MRRLQTEDSLRGAFLEAYGKASARDGEAFCQRVLTALPERRGALSVVWRHMAVWLRYYVTSPLWMWTSVIVCICVCRRQIVELSYRILDGGVQMLTPDFWYAALLLVSALVLVLREMFRDQRMQLTLFILLLSSFLTLPLGAARKPAPLLIKFPKTRTKVVQEENKKTCYEVDPMGRVTTKTVYRWNAGLERWQPTSCFHVDYQSQGRQSFTYQRWNPRTRSFETFFSEVYDTLSSPILYLPEKKR